VEETSEELPNFSFGIDLLARKQPTSKSKTNENEAVELWMHLVFSAHSDQKCLLREQLGE